VSRLRDPEVPTSIIALPLIALPASYPREERGEERLPLALRLFFNAGVWRKQQ
jgi:hypothetical protein